MPKTKLKVAGVKRSLHNKGGNPPYTTFKLKVWVTVNGNKDIEVPLVSRQDLPKAAYQAEKECAGGVFFFRRNSHLYLQQPAYQPSSYCKIREISGNDWDEKNQGTSSEGRRTWGLCSIPHSKSPEITCTSLPYLEQPLRWWSQTVEKFSAPPLPLLLPSPLFKDDLIFSNWFSFSFLSTSLQASLLNREY